MGGSIKSVLVAASIAALAACASSGERATFRVPEVQYRGDGRTDADACSAVRAFHDAEIALSATDLAVLARYTASP